MLGVENPARRRDMAETIVTKADVTCMYFRDLIELGTAALKKNPRLLVVDK
jgi:hypothetical protein